MSPDREAFGLDLDRIGAAPGSSLESPRFRPSGAGEFPPGAVGPVRPGPGVAGIDEITGHTRRAGGPVSTFGPGRSPRRRSPPGPRLDLLVEEARRRAEALEDWERTGF